MADGKLVLSPYKQQIYGDQTKKNELSFVLTFSLPSEYCYDTFSVERTMIDLLKYEYSQKGRVVLCKCKQKPTLHIRVQVYAIYVLILAYQVTWWKNRNQHGFL